MLRYFKWMGLLLLLVIVVVLSGLYVASQPTPISAFYQTPKIESTWLAGQLIRQQAVPDDLPQHAQAWRILYVSTNNTQQKIALSAMVIAPITQSTTPRPILLWAHGSVGVLPHCAVSHTRHPHQQTPALQDMIDRGWIVVVPDYQGLGTAGVHSYLLGEPSSRALWDAVKATTQLPLLVGQRVMIWGASQGGQAALWAAERASIDAPTFEVVATAVSAPAITLIPIKLNQQEFKRRCARGDQVQMVQLTGIGHDAREESAALTLTWLQQRWLGQPMDTSCVIKTQG